MKQRELTSSHQSENTTSTARQQRPVKLLLVNVRSPEYPLITAPLGIITLGGYLKRKFARGVEIQYIDLQLDGPGDVAKTIAKTSPDIIGLSVKVGGTEAMNSLLRDITSAPMGRPPQIILGNVVPTYAAHDILRSFPQVICCVGRGELTLRRLVELVASDTDAIELTQIPNCCFVSGDEVCETTGESFNLDELGTADWDGLFNRYESARYQEIWIEASRGCPQKKGGVGCSFCAIMPNAGSRDWRSRLFDDVLLEIELLSSYEVKHIRFADEEFMAGQTVAAFELAKSLRDLRLKLGSRMPTFDFAIRVDDVFKRGPRSNRAWTQVINDQAAEHTDNEIRKLALTTFKDAGLVQVYLGLESGAFNQLKRMYKAALPRDNETALTVLREIGLQVAAGWIMIDPLMVGLDDLKENISFLQRNDLIPESPTSDFITNPISRMRVLAGSPLIDQLRGEGLLGDKKANLIEYEFSYKDLLIGHIAKLLERWENPSRALIYAVKNMVALAVLRKEGSFQLERLATFLFQLKSVDFDLISHLVSEAEKLGAHRFMGRTRVIPTELVEKRQSLIDKLIADVRAGIIKDEAGTIISALNSIGSVAATTSEL